jgi:hypothetical protein
MVDILSEKIHDGRFLWLVRDMLSAGYLEDWVWNATLSGAPQGGVVSPVLSNIYLHKLDEHVETVLIPQYTQGKCRRSNPAYARGRKPLAYARKCGDRAKARELHKQLRRLPTGDQADPGFRRLRYSRYADLSRCRHKSAYAEDRIMRRFSQKAGEEAVTGLGSSA